MPTLNTTLHDKSCPRLTFFVKGTCKTLDANIASFRAQLAETHKRMSEVAARNHELQKEKERVELERDEAAQSAEKRSAVFIRNVIVLHGQAPAGIRRDVAHRNLTVRFLMHGNGEHRSGIFLKKSSKNHQRVNQNCD